MISISIGIVMILLSLIPTPSSAAKPIPPQPKQYTTTMQIYDGTTNNTSHQIYYVDLINENNERDRIDC